MEKQWFNTLNSLKYVSGFVVKLLWDTNLIFFRREVLVIGHRNSFLTFYLGVVCGSESAPKMALFTFLPWRDMRSRIRPQDGSFYLFTFLSGGGLRPRISPKTAHFTFSQFYLGLRSRIRPQEGSFYIFTFLLERGMRLVPKTSHFTALPFQLGVDHTPEYGYGYGIRTRHRLFLYPVPVTFPYCEFQNHYLPVPFTHHDFRNQSVSVTFPSLNS